MSIKTKLRHILERAAKAIASEPEHRERPLEQLDRVEKQIKEEEVKKVAKKKVEKSPAEEMDEWMRRQGCSPIVRKRPARDENWWWKAWW